MKQLSARSIDGLDIKDLIQYSIFKYNSDDEKLRATVLELKNEKISGFLYGFLTHYDNGIESKVYSKHIPFFFINEKIKKAALSIFKGESGSDGVDKMDKLIIIKGKSESHNFPDVGTNQKTSQSVMTLVINNNIFEFLMSYVELQESRSNNTLFKSIKAYASNYEITQYLPEKAILNQTTPKIKI